MNLSTCNLSKHESVNKLIYLYILFLCYAINIWMINQKIYFALGKKLYFAQLFPCINFKFSFYKALTSLINKEIALF